MGITEQELQKLIFVSDNGGNVVKALENFRRLYCMCHALNICNRSGMSIKYHELLLRCLESSPRALQVVHMCDEAVRSTKDCRGREATRRMAAVKRGLKKSMRHLNSYYQMLLSLRTRFEDVSS